MVKNRIDFVLFDFGRLWTTINEYKHKFRQIIKQTKNKRRRIECFRAHAIVGDTFDSHARATLIGAVNAFGENWNSRALP